jgi:hypothetical protein
MLVFVLFVAIVKIEGDTEKEQRKRIKVALNPAIVAVCALVIDFTLDY